MAEVPHPPFQPIPTAISVSVDRFEDAATGVPQSFVQVMLGFPNGITAFYMDPVAAREFAHKIVQHADMAASGLTVVSSIPHSNGHKQT